MVTPTQEAEARKAIDRSIKVKEILASDAWTEIIHEQWERTIADIVGGKVDGVWLKGKLKGYQKDEEIKYYLGYKDALVDFYNFLQDTLILGEQAKQVINKVGVKPKKSGKKINTFEIKNNKLG